MSFLLSENIRKPSNEGSSWVTPRKFYTIEENGHPQGVVHCDVNGNPINLGSTTEPIYLKDGEFYQCTNTTNMNDLINKLYPIGSIYMNYANSKNPSELFGVGTWEKISEGRFLVSANSTTGQATFNNNITGGSNVAKTVKHTHTFPTTSLQHFHRPATSNYSFVVISEGSDIAVNLQSDGQYEVSKLGAAVGNDSNYLLGANVYIRANQLSNKSTKKYNNNINYSSNISGNTAGTPSTTTAAPAIFNTSANGSSVTQQRTGIGEDPATAASDLTLNAKVLPVDSDSGSLLESSNSDGNMPSWFAVYIWRRVS